LQIPYSKKRYLSDRDPTDRLDRENQDTTSTLVPEFPLVHKRTTLLPLKRFQNQPIENKKSGAHAQAGF